MPTQKPKNSKNLNKKDKEALKLLRNCPSPEIVKDWIEQRNLSNY